MRGKRMIWGGRAPVRSALYLSIWSAAKGNPVIRLFHDRLRANGKPPKVAQAACMRKLPTILNAMGRDGQPWDDSEKPKEDARRGCTGSSKRVLCGPTRADSSPRGHRREEFVESWILSDPVQTWLNREPMNPPHPLPNGLFKSLERKVMGTQAHVSDRQANEPDVLLFSTSFDLL